MKGMTQFDSFVQELENQLLTNEEQVLLLAGQGSGLDLSSIPPVNNCKCGGDNCHCHGSNNCTCDGANNCTCNGLNNCNCNNG